MNRVQSPVLDFDFGDDAVEERKRGQFLKSPEREVTGLSRVYI